MDWIGGNCGSGRLDRCRFFLMDRVLWIGETSGSGTVDRERLMDRRSTMGVPTLAIGNSVPKRIQRKEKNEKLKDNGRIGSLPEEDA